MKKIGEIKGIPVVEGNINEVNKNQIHYKENNGNIQLSKRGNDNKLNSVTGSVGSSGSGEGGGVKEYYYKVLLPQEALVDTIVGMQTNGFIKFLVKNKKGITETAIMLSADKYKEDYHNILPYVKIYDIQYQYVSMVDSSLYSGNIYNMGSGDLFARMAKMMNMEYEVVKEQLKDTIQEITKEEYESLITYRVE